MLKDGPISAQEIANQYKTTLADILEDIDHIRISNKIKIDPAVCLVCGFVFKERSKIKTPSKCPGCRGERVQACRMSIK